jgi:hypothetical protein
MTRRIRPHEEQIQGYTDVQLNDWGIRHTRVSSTKSFCRSRLNDLVESTFFGTTAQSGANLNQRGMSQGLTGHCRDRLRHNQGESRISCPS